MAKVVANIIIYDSSSCHQYISGETVDSLLISALYLQKTIPLFLLLLKPDFSYFQFLDFPTISKQLSPTAPYKPDQHTVGPARFSYTSKMYFCIGRIP